jgi:hypothetical protein
MERWAANTLRTFGLIIVSIIVIALSLGLALLGLCFAILASADHHGGATPQSNNFFYFGIAGGLVVLVGGIFLIGSIARVIFRESKIQDTIQGQQRNQPYRSDLPPLPPYSLIPPAPQTTAQPNIVVPHATAPTSPSAPISAPAPTPPAQRRPTLDAARHLSPASRVAIDRLILAIAAQASAQLIVGVIEWLWTGQIVMSRLRLHGPLLFAWNLAAIAPYALLAYTLRRQPGPTAFSFCLVIPGMRSVFGFFGQTASIIIFLRTFHSGMPLLSAIPWVLDVLIFYLAWKAVRLTGIEPTPARLILSAVDIFLYSVSLPVLFLLLNAFWR